MTKQKIKKQNKPKPKPKSKSKTKSKKTITVYTVIRAIMLTLLCLIMLLGIAERIWHYYNYHFK
jgi:ribosomal protein S14